ncbi:MAG: hypothetical protein ABEJ23_04260 [Haloarculaceae archaeon]
MRHYDPPSETVPQWRRGPENELSLNDVFSILADKRRRLLLYALQDAAGEVAVDRLRDQILAWEGETVGRDRSRRHLSIALRHRHLPRLDALGVVDFDADAGVVVYYGHPLLARWLSQTRELDQI